MAFIVTLHLRKLKHLNYHEGNRKKKKELIVVKIQD